jgi:peptide/nickel transport system permease protein
MWNAARCVAVAVVAAYALLAAFAPWLAPFGEAQLLGTVWQPPSAAHWLGTDGLGRDMLSRLLYGGRTTISLAAMATALSFILGAGCGLSAAIIGSWLDIVLSRIVDALLALPTLIVALLVISVLGSSLLVLICVTSVLEATRFFRLSRGVGRDVMATDYVEVARLRREGLLWFLRREIFPNVVSILAAEAALRFGFIVLFISGLSFLGLGVQPPQTDWGGMVRENAIALTFGLTAPLLPALAIAGLTISLNVIAGGIGTRRGALAT